MSESIHGHQVMELMLENGGEFSEQSLLELLSHTFGADAQYHTCKQEQMSAQDLIVFLEQRGKFVKKDTGFNTCRSKICSH